MTSIVVRTMTEHLIAALDTNIQCQRIKAVLDTNIRCYKYNWSTYVNGALKVLGITTEHTQ